MSRAFFYKCDGCGKPTGKQPHIVAQFVGQSGIALPPNSKWSPADGWRVVQGTSGVFQFHNGVCLGRFFDLKMSAATDKD